MMFKSTHYLFGAPNEETLPVMDGKEVAFVGRSNVGKSSALNAIVGKTIARASKHPGRTQLIQVFSTDAPNWRIVDLPGYGYAAVSRKKQIIMQTALLSYLEERQALRLLFLIVDARRGMLPLDIDLLSAIQAREEIHVHVLLSKSDKLTLQESWKAYQNFLSFKEKAVYAFQMTGQLFSIRKPQQIREGYLAMTQWMGGEAKQDA